MGAPAEAERHWRDVAGRESRLLYHDGLRAMAYDQLAEYALLRGDYSNTVALARRALECDPQAAGAFNHLALASLKLGDMAAAYSHVAGALKLDPMNGLYLWSAAQVAAVRGENDLALTFLQAAVNNGFRDAAAIHGSEVLRKALGTARGRHVLQPPLTTLCSEQLINHRFAVSNMSGYAVSGLVVRLTVRYETGEREAQEESFSRRMSVVPAGGLIGFAMAGAPKGQFRCRMQLDYECADHPELKFRSVSCHNMEGQGEHLEWADYLHRRALEALKEGDRKRQEEGYKMVAEAAEWTVFENAEILGTCARLASSLGDEAGVKRYSDAARKAMMQRPLLDSVQVEAAVKRLGEGGRGETLDFRHKTIDNKEERNQ
jgi:tetratricopeptide (TPR) repeat protein